MRQSEHLHEVGHRALAAIVLPVGVGDEADRCVEGEIGSDSRHALRIERQEFLKAHERVEEQKARDMKEQHRDRVHDPMLLAALIDAGDAVEADLNWA
jgi:hypothetical protein